MNFYAYRITSDARPVLRGPGTGQEVIDFLDGERQHAEWANLRVNGDPRMGVTIGGHPHTEYGETSWTKWSIEDAEEAKRLERQGVPLLPLVLQQRQPR